MATQALKLLSSILLVYSVACGGSNETVEQWGQASKISPDITDTATLGQAYNSKSMKVLNLPCITGTMEELGNQEGSLIFDRDMSFEKLLKTISGELSVGVKLPVVSVDASANIAAENSKDELSETYHLFWNGIRKKKVLTPGTLKLTEDGDFYSQFQSDALEQKCGDEFITEISLGAQFMATLRVDFLNEQDKMDVGGKINVDVYMGLVGVDGSLNVVDDKVKRRTKVKLSVIQKGGDPGKLIKHLPEKLVECTMSAPNNCLQAFREIMLYAKGDFAQQLEDSSNYNVLGYTTRKYSESGRIADKLMPPQGYQIITEAVSQRIDSVEDELRKAIKDELRAMRLLNNGSEYMTQEKRDQISSMKETITRNIDILAKISKYCYENMNTNCLDFYKAHYPSVSEYNTGILQIQVTNTDPRNKPQCEEIRLAALKAGRITQEYYDRLKRRNWVPIFQDNDPVDMVDMPKAEVACEWLD
jgi:hypothetical protein